MRESSADGSSRRDQRVRETERVRRLYDKDAHRYDRAMHVMERLLFVGGREWVCAQARGDVLEIAIGTGRNSRTTPPTCG